MINADERRFWGKSDSETIQNAVDFAEKSGEGYVIIPKYNTRTGNNIWIIDVSIKLPSNMTVYLASAHLRLADGVMQNIFTNKQTYLPGAVRTAENEEHDIRILGDGNAVLDGGEHNGLTEQKRRDHPEIYPPLDCNLLVFFTNVRDFEIGNIKVRDSRWWALCFYFCRWGKLHDIDFRNYATVENQDGIDLRVGCEYITIENITGITGDDTVALTALPCGKTVARYAVAGKSMDIHDINIRNITSATHGCSLVRFLNEDGAAEYNITVENIKDTGESISGAAIFCGQDEDYPFAKKRPRTFGEFRNVVIRNVTTCAQRGLRLSDNMQDVLVENLFCYGSNEIAVQTLEHFGCDNLTIRNVVVDQSPEYADSAFSITENADIKQLNIENVRVRNTKYVFRRSQPEVKNLLVDKAEETFTEEAPHLASAYGRYFKSSFGQEIKDRAKGNQNFNEKI